MSLGTSKVKILESTEPLKKKGGVVVKDVDELIQKLQKEAKIF